MPARLVDCSWFVPSFSWSSICWWMVLVLLSSSFMVFVLLVLVASCLFLMLTSGHVVC